MDRRDFFKDIVAGLVTILLGGCNFTSPGKTQQKPVAAAVTGSNAQQMPVTPTAAAHSTQHKSVTPPAADSDNGSDKKMKITVITGSPHKNGTSALLAEKFIAGAKTAGHDVFRFDAAFEEVHPCNGCDYCLRNNSICIYNDSMEKLNGELLAADLVVFVTPLYYFGMSAQLKTVIDRFYAHSSPIHGTKKAILMATAWNSDDWTMQALTEHYKILLRYLNWEDAGMILAIGCGVRSDIERSDFPNQAYQLGLNL